MFLIWIQTVGHSDCIFLKDISKTVNFEKKSADNINACKITYHTKRRGYEPRCENSRSSGFPTRSDTNQAVQPQKMARGLKFRI